MSRAQHIVRALARGLNRAFGSRAGSRVGMLVYHRVQPKRAGVAPATFSVTPGLFRQHLTGLTAAGYQFVKLSDVLAARRRGQAMPPKSVVITFDDAFESVHKYALPVMRELAVPATAFLSTAYIDSTEPFPFDRWGTANRELVPPQDYRPLRREQCQELLASGWFELGAHTHTHQDFRNRPRKLRLDLEQNVACLREWFQLDDVTFAFPFGKSTLGYAGGELSQAAREAGTCCALTTDCQLIDPLADDPWQWGRFSATQEDDAGTLAAKLAGWYGWATMLQARLDRLRGYDRSVEYDAPPSTDISLASSQPTRSLQVSP